MRLAVAFPHELLAGRDTSPFDLQDKQGGGDTEAQKHTEKFLQELFCAPKCHSVKSQYRAGWSVRWGQSSRENLAGKQKSLDSSMENFDVSSKVKAETPRDFVQSTAA